AAAKSGFHELQRDAPADGFPLFSEPDLAHAPFADFLYQLVAADAHAGLFRSRRVRRAILLVLRGNRWGFVAIGRIEALRQQTGGAATIGIERSAAFAA